MSTVSVPRFAQASAPRWTVLGWTMAALAAMFWGWHWYLVATLQGPFRWAGVDFANYRSQALAFVTGGGAAMYNLPAMQHQLDALAAYTTHPDLAMQLGPVPFPPLFAWLMIPFSLPDARVGFGLWTAINIVAAVYLARRAAQLFPSRRWLIGALALTSFPVVHGLMCGEPTVLMGCAFAEGYLALRDGKDFRAGLWIACLLIKPQYALIIGPLLIWKRQWRAVAGAIAGVAGILAASLVVAGPDALLAYPSSFFGLSGFDTASAAPDQMINWRGAIVRLAPNVPSYVGLALALGLGVITLLPLIPIWRGPWTRGDLTFDLRMTSAVVVTLVANYHSHLHGATVLIVPLAGLLAQPGVSRVVTAAAKELLLLPPFVLFFTHSNSQSAWPFLACLVAILGSIAASHARRHYLESESTIELSMKSAALAVLAPGTSMRDRIVSMP